MKINIFYSWQSTTSTKYNKNFISDCLKTAIKKLRNMPEYNDVEFELLDAVRGEPGSVSVADTILDKRIPNCDIFVGDLSVVNHIPKWLKYIQKFTGNKYKPFQNNNVINEHGVARNAIGKEKIIGVMNKEFGSPKENPDNIPFDLAHMRFPIEYEYSQKNDKKKKNEKKLVQDLVGALKLTVNYTIENRKNQYAPFLIWKEWEKEENTKQFFYSNQKIKEISDFFIQSISNKHANIRFLGLSGIGKTRILLEAFRGHDDSSKKMSARILYWNYNMNPNPESLINTLREIIKVENDRVVIVDNCPKDLHRKLSRLTNNNENKVSLITIDSNPEEYEYDKINDITYLLLKKEEFVDVVESIVNTYADLLSEENRRRVIEFSQGIPLMAVLLAESIKNGEKYIGRLEDKDLLSKLLGTKGQEEDSRSMLKTCSLFKYIGYEEDMGKQLAFVAANKKITTVDGDEQITIQKFREICHHYLKREIFERKGRYIGMRPFPLAISLAQEWLETCTSQRLLDIILDIAKLEEPHRTQLAQALCEQMKYLNYSDKAQEIIENIVGERSPFDSAEVLNTELGSRLFRSFSEVNPIAISQNFNRNFATKTTEELRLIREGRRNIVWTLEKLCFDRNTFIQSAKIMYRFAVAENEDTISNNATGQFLHLFNVMLAGTEANLGERLAIIDWGLNKDSSEYKNLALKAMKVGLGWGHFVRFNGAEKQGVRVLEDYRPSGKEIAEYWETILSKLISIIKSNDEFSEIASDIISGNIFSVCKAGYASIIMPFIQEIAEYKKYDWDNALQSLKQIRKNDKYSIQHHQKTVDDLIEKLTKTDFATRYISSASSYYFEDGENYSHEKLIAVIEKLADEFIDAKLSWKDYFPLFYSNTQGYTYYFGKRIYDRIKSDKDVVNQFVDESLEVIRGIKREQINISVLSGFIHDMNGELKNEIYDKIEKDGDLCFLLFNLIPQHSPTLNQFDRLFQLIDDGKCNLSYFEQLRFGSLNGLNKEDFVVLSNKFFEYGSSGYDIAFDVLFTASGNNYELKKELTPIFKECIYTIGFGKTFRHQLDDYKWYKTISDILQDESEGDFAKFINTSIINSISIDNLYHLNHDVQRIYEVLMTKHFNAIWKDLSEALLATEEKYLTFYGLKHILGSQIGGIGREIGVLFDGDIDMIFAWCKNCKPLAPARLAELIPVFGENNTWHPIAFRLINEFGDIQDVLNNLDANMGTFSWIGSIVPLLESQKEIFVQIQNHPIENVSQWANLHLEYINKRIKDEKNRDEEMFL